MYRNARFTTRSRKREAVSDSPDGEAVGRSFRTLIEHIGKERVSANSDLMVVNYSTLIEIGAVFV